MASRVKEGHSYIAWKYSTSKLAAGATGNAHPQEYSNLFLHTLIVAAHLEEKVRTLLRPLSPLLPIKDIRIITLPTFELKPLHFEFSICLMCPVPFIAKVFILINLSVFDRCQRSRFTKHCSPLWSWRYEARVKVQTWRIYFCMLRPVVYFCGAINCAISCSHQLIMFIQG